MYKIMGIYNCNKNINKLEKWSKYWDILLKINYGSMKL